MNQKFTIRPKPQEGETFSGYIMRISEVNCTKFWSVMAYLGIKSGYVYSLDDSPEKIVSISNLTSLLGVDEESILKMTFSNLFNQFYFNSTLEERLLKRSTVSDEIVKNKRRYCISCLRENRYYKLVWQIKEVNICSIHFTKLQSCCSLCGTKQPYISSALSTFSCYKCGSDISIQLEPVIKDQNEINEQLKIIDDWSFLLSEKFSINNDLYGYSREKFLVMASFYVSQGMEEIFDRGSISFFESGEMTDYLRFIYDLSGGKCMSLKMILRLSRNFNISLDRLLSISIPESYINSLEVYRSKFENKALGVCLAPWCNSYKSNKSLTRIHSRKGIKNHYSFSICKECFNKYGYNKNTGDWENIGGFIDLLWNKVLPSLNSHDMVEKISRKYKIDRYIIKNAIGYADNYKLLNEELSEKYKPKNIPNDIISYFSYLYELMGPMRRNAYKYFRWSSCEFYYYMNIKEVQDYLIFEKNMFFKKDSCFNARKEQFKKRFQDILEYYIQIDKDINLKNLSKDLKCTDNKIYDHGLKDIMRDAVIKQYEKRKIINKEKIMNKVEIYFEQKKLLDDLLVYNKVHKDLELSRSQLGLEKETIEKLVSSKVKEHNNKVITNRTQQLVEQANEIIKEFSMIGEKVTYKKIALLLGISLSSLRKNVEFKNAIDEIRRNY
ncbi:TniQ family protein [Clostridium sp. C8]|nr:TniQ family protein [Clostridium sp. C8]KLE15726.1 hypothetical protein AAT22_09980 [Clostridium sp. C8]